MGGQSPPVHPVWRDACTFLPHTFPCDKGRGAGGGKPTARGFLGIQDEGFPSVPSAAPAGQGLARPLCLRKGQSAEAPLAAAARLKLCASCPSAARGPCGAATSCAITTSAPSPTAPASTPGRRAAPGAGGRQRAAWGARGGGRGLTPPPVVVVGWVSGVERRARRASVQGGGRPEGCGPVRGHRCGGRARFGAIGALCCVHPATPGAPGPSGCPGVQQCPVTEPRDFLPASFRAFPPSF